jgi:elongator complex protein 1
MYKETSIARQYSKTPEEARHCHVSKVNRICDGFLEVLQTRQSTNLFNLISAHVCKSPPDLGAALEAIDELRSKLRI